MVKQINRARPHQRGYLFPNQEDKKLFSTAEAADYLGLKLSTMKYHVFTAGNVRFQMVGNSLVFIRSDLDEFKKNKRGPGRPPKDEA